MTESVVERSGKITRTELAQTPEGRHADSRIAKKPMPLWQEFHLVDPVRGSLMPCFPGGFTRTCNTILSGCQASP
jgi:hypothetical protein